MKRSIDFCRTGDLKKKAKFDSAEETESASGGGDGGGGGGFVNLDENLLYEVLKHVDARTLGLAACVSKMWNRTAQDERLWELICTRHWCSVNFAGAQQLRSVVLALGGFRRLHSLYIWPLTKQKTSSSPAPAALPVVPAAVTRWGKDEDP